MTIGSAAAGAREKLEGLREILRQLALALDDVPEPGNEPAVVESLRATAADIENEVAESIAGWESPAANSRLVISAATGSQQAMNRAARRLHDELASPESIAEIVRAGRERGGAWRRWSDVVCRVLEECKHRHYEALDALAGCFSEYVERNAESLRRA